MAPCRTIMRMTLPALAPSAMRIPTSWVRRLTENDVTPYSPATARISAAMPKTMKMPPNTSTAHRFRAMASSSVQTQ